MRESLNVECWHGSLQSLETDVVVVGVHIDKVLNNPAVKALDSLSERGLTAFIKSEDFKGKKGEVLRLDTPKLKIKRMVLLGLGKPSEHASAEMATRLLGVKSSEIGAKKRKVTVIAPNDDAKHVRALAEGLKLGAYQYTDYKSKQESPKLKRAVIALGQKIKPEHRRAIEQATAIAESANYVRDLVNCPPNAMNPRALADSAAKESKALGIRCDVWDKARIKKEKMNLLLAVNAGSGEEPRFIHMHYKPKNAKKRVVFVGKGLTFDSGGLCIKPSKSMLDMKCDMTGGAVTIGVVLAAARLKLPVEVHAVVPSTENMTGEFAYRPGDIYTGLNGKTVEIINTDAEGRLILADALVYAQRLKPDWLIDHATLTGACMVALGAYTAGLFCNDEGLAERYLGAAKETGETYWRLPLDTELKDSLKSHVADMQHTGDSYGGAITAALFLQEFVGDDTKWMHLDIAGPAFLDRPKSIYPKGASGFGVITATRFLESL